MYIMNWWGIVVETCLNSLHKCLFMFVCWWGLNWCGCLWSLNEKWENCGCWWKMNIMMILMRIDVIIPRLLLFWLPFLVNKFSEQILVEVDQNWGSWMKIGWVPERKPKIWVPLCRWTQCGKWLLVVASCSIHQPMSFAFRVLQGEWFLSKALETLNELDWAWFCESNQTFWKMFKNTWFYETCFSQRRRVGLGLFTVTMIYKNVLDGMHEL